MPPNRNLVFGVDFSGSKEPGDKIWITEVDQQYSGDLQVTQCCSAATRFNTPKNSPRRVVYRELQTFIKQNPTAVFGFDFPFSLPESVIGTASSWREHIAEIDQQFQNKSAEEFRNGCAGRASVASEDGSYHRRETDWRYGGSCPYQPRIQHQTLHGQRDFLNPLIIKDEAKALPMQNADNNLPWLIEVYPRSTLSKLGLYRSGYKSHQQSANRRTKNIAELQDRGIDIPDSLVRDFRKSDDAHDSLAAAIATAHALQDGFRKDDTSLDIEGQIFA